MNHSVKYTDCEVMSGDVSLFITQQCHCVTGSTTSVPPQPFYDPFSGTTRVSRCQTRTSGLYGAGED